MLLKTQLQQTKAEITYLKAGKQKVQIIYQQYVAQYGRLQQHVKELLRRDLGTSSDPLIDGFVSYQYLFQGFQHLFHCAMVEDVARLLRCNIKYLQNLIISKVVT